MSSKVSSVFFVVLMVLVTAVVMGYPLIPLIMKNENEITTNNGITTCNIQLENIKNNKNLLNFAGTMNLLITLGLCYFLYYFNKNGGTWKGPFNATLFFTIYMAGISISCFSIASRKL